MRGFLRRTPVATALEWIDSRTAPLAAEQVPLASATGRVLAASVRAEIDVPPFARSAMDGYAVRADETVGAGDYAPITLQVVGEALPGRAWTGTLQAGEAVRIMTGAPLPAGADAVVPAEHAQLLPAPTSPAPSALPTSGHDSVEIRLAVPRLKHVGQIGEDLRRGADVLPAGRRLRPQDVAVIASLGCPSIAATRRPRVRLLVTGDELVPPGQPRGPHDIYEANSFLLRGLIERDGGELFDLQRLRDDPAQLRAALSAPGADVVLVSGGTSVGREDHAPRLVAELGELAIHGVAMRPSSPAGIGSLKNDAAPALVFLLPGNPVSCLCAYDFFAGRALRRLGGRPADWPYPRRTGRLGRKIASEVGRTDYCRVRWTDAGIEPLALSGASILSSSTRADGFVVIPESSEGFPAGATIDCWAYDP